MIILVVADRKEFRATRIGEVLTQAAESEVLMHDEMDGTVADLERYLYPSLFSITPPLIHVKFMIASDPEMVQISFLKKLAASPTVFIFEEMTLSSPLVTVFKKSGAILHTEGKEKSIKRGPDMFTTIASIITAPDKKSRWMAYRRALDEHAVEAIMGIMYWKVRDMAAKGNRERNLDLYKKMLAAHARAWQTGVPLELMIEKVLLT